MVIEPSDSLICLKISFVPYSGKSFTHKRTHAHGTRSPLNLSPKATSFSRFEQTPQGHTNWLSSDVAAPNERVDILPQQRIHFACPLTSAIFQESSANETSQQGRLSKENSFNGTSFEESPSGQSSSRESSSNENHRVAGTYKDSSSMEGSPNQTSSKKSSSNESTSKEKYSNPISCRELF